MNFPPDLIEERIKDIKSAWKLLKNQLPQFDAIYQKWHQWYIKQTSGTAMQDMIVDAFVICYARMSLRNGTLSLHARNYHNEKHIDELILRLIDISSLPEAQCIPKYGWSLLSLFMCSHDLRQDELANNDGPIGYNEQASYQEILRLINKIDTKGTMRQEHKELLKLMIHGSTFRAEQDISGNIYKGNLVEHILNNVEYFEDIDKELAYLACDIDTANVAMDLKDYSQSSINVYNEMKNDSNKDVSARQFFGCQQQQYFFRLQKFNSKIGQIAFAQGKTENANKIEKICCLIEELDEDMPDEEIVDHYQSYVSTKL